MKKMFLLLLVAVTMTSNVALGQQLKYTPASGLTQTELEKIVKENKKSGVKVSADANTSSEYEEAYGFLVLSRGEHAIVVFNYDCDAYVVVLHKLLSIAYESNIQAYGILLFPTAFNVNSPNPTLEQIEEKFGASIWKFTKDSLQACLTMLTD